VNWFKKTKLVLIRRISSRVRLSEWRGSQTLVQSARKYLQDPEFLTMIDVLRNESPINWVAIRQMTIDDRAVMHARIEGYQLCLNNLEALGSFQKPEETLEPSFEQPEEQEGS
jgi:hypothetical protein